MSRSGTTWLLDQLNLHPNCCAFGETAFFGKHFIPTKNGEYTVAQIDQVLSRMPGTLGVPTSPPEDSVVRRVLAGEALRKLFDPLRKKLVGRDAGMACAEVFREMLMYASSYKGGDVVIEKTPHHLLYVQRIARFFPKAKFIVCHRDPEGFVLSWKHQGDRKTTEVKRRFKRMYHPISVAFIWRRYAEHVCKLTRSQALVSIEVPYCSIKSKPIEVMTDLYNFCEVDPEYARPLDGNKQNSSFPNRRIPKLSALELACLRVICRKPAQALGYDVPRASWDAWLLFCFSCLTVPLWAMRCFFSMPSPSRLTRLLVWAGFKRPN